MTCAVCGQKELFKGKVYSTYNKKPICPTCLSKHVFVCSICGKVERDCQVKKIKNKSQIEKNKWLKYGENKFACPTCASTKLKSCKKCGSLFSTENETLQELSICEECAPYFIVKSAVSKKYIDRDYAINVHDGPFMVPVSPLEYSDQTYVRKCSFCEEYHVIFERPFKKEGKNNFVCDKCFSRTKHCNKCGDLFVPNTESVEKFVFDIADEIQIAHQSTTEEETELICESCKKSSIDSYHANHERAIVFRDLVDNKSHETVKLFGESNSSNLYMGFELEVDSLANVPESQINACAIRVSEFLDDSFITITHDGSLERGFEIVSSPSTLEWYEKYWSRTYKPMTSIIRRYGLRSHDPGTCGLHVHVSSNAIRNVDELKKWFTWFVPEIVVFSRRLNFSYCIPSLWNKNEISSLSFEEFCRTIIPSRGHGVALNTSNTATVEFRIFRGTINANTLLATLQFVDGFIRYVNSHKLSDLSNTSWNDITKSIEKKEFQNYISKLDFNKFDKYFERDSKKIKTCGIPYVVSEWNDEKEELPNA